MPRWQQEGLRFEDWCRWGKQFPGYAAWCEQKADDPAGNTAALEPSAAFCVAAGSTGREPQQQNSQQLAWRQSP